jgi:hypothetical protein
MNYSQLQQAIQDYMESSEATFVANIPRFIQEAEDRIYNSVQLPALRKNVTGSLTLNNPYLTLPTDWLSTYSVAVIDTTGAYNYMLNKDVNYIREAFPYPATVGFPTHYALFGSSISNINDLTLLVGPTPDKSYSTELHYFYYPPTIVQGEISNVSTLIGGSTYVVGNYYNVPISGGSGTNATANVVVSSAGIVTSVVIENGGQFYTTNDILTISNTYLGNSGTGLSFVVSAVTNASGTSWLGINFDPVLLYGALREAALFQKQEQDMVADIENKFQEALGQLKRLGDGLERGDAYRDGQTKLKVKT